MFDYYLLRCQYLYLLWLAIQLYIANQHSFSPIDYDFFCDILGKNNHLYAKEVLFKGKNVDFDKLYDEQVKPYPVPVLYLRAALTLFNIYFFPKRVLDRVKEKDQPEPPKPTYRQTMYVLYKMLCCARRSKAKLVVGEAMETPMPSTEKFTDLVSRQRATDEEGMEIS
jgi:hypothetical protein